MNKRCSYSKPHNKTYGKNNYYCTIKGKINNRIGDGRWCKGELHHGYANRDSNKIGNSFKDCVHYKKNRQDKIKEILK